MRSEFELHATYTETVQTGYDSFQPATRVMRLTRETTMGEVVDWYMRQFAHPDKVAHIYMMLAGEREPDYA